jgi:hypothetical protein
MYSKYQIDENTFTDKDGTKFSERDCCNHCKEYAEVNNKPFAFAD